MIYFFAVNQEAGMTDNCSYNSTNEPTCKNVTPLIESNKGEY